MGAETIVGLVVAAGTLVLLHRLTRAEREPVVEELEELPEVA